MVTYVKNKNGIQARLRRTEGEVRGIQKMVGEDRLCVDVLTKVNGVRAAFESAALQQLADHTEHCVTEAIRAASGGSRVRKLNAVVERLVRS